MRELFEQISSLKEKYDKIAEKKKFNIITALHKERDEVNLHSRIISYLLCPTSGHGMRDTYLKIFVRYILQLNESQFNLNNISVVPNEFNKTEYKEIDILLANKRTSQAIIIENKIDAHDSNNPNNGIGYKGQLERYYSTIVTGKDSFGKQCEEFKSNHVYVFYLSFKNQPPGDISLGILKDKPNSWRDSHVLSYDSNISEWLVKCLEITPEENLDVKFFIQHYLNLINKMTNNNLPIEERLKLKEIVSKNITSSKYLIDNFKHVKWHTTHEFWTELKNQIEIKFEVKCNFFPIEIDQFNKIISKVTHYEEKINHGVVFKIKKKELYISGENRLSWGLIEPKKWTNFYSDNAADINLSDFSIESTYQLIDKTKMAKVIQEMLFEISCSLKNDFENPMNSN